MSALKNVRLNEPWKTAQTEKADDRQIKNAAGGYTFQVSDKDRFRRFLTIGVDGGTYYIGEQKLTKDNVQFVQKYIAQNGDEAVNEIVHVSDNGLAPKNTQALFALAIALDSDDQATKAAAKSAVNKVARTAPHIFEFAQFLKNNSGLGRAKTSALANWLTEKDKANNLAYQSVKYRQRQGWTLRDIMRISHPKGINPSVGNYILRGEIASDAPEIIQTFGRLQSAKSESEVIKLLKGDKNASWEMVPTEFHKSAKVWKTLFENGMPHTALIRNTKRFHELGLFDDMLFANEYATALTDENAISRGRVHPIQFLNAYVGYGGDLNMNNFWGSRSTGVSNPNAHVKDALMDGYELAFKNVEPANKRTLVGLDVSGSMSTKASGLNISCATLGAAMCQLILKKEPSSAIRGFTGEFIDLGITKRDSLETVFEKTQNHNFGPTNTAAPMEWALKNRIEVDTFVIFTDIDTWSGSQHTHEALDRYRQKSGIDARFICVAAQATSNTVADPNDVGSIDLSGFDSSAPKFIADFSAGRI